MDEQPDHRTLTPFEHEAIDLALARYKRRGVREDHIRDLLIKYGQILPNTTPAVTFWQIINALTEDPAAAAARPADIAHLKLMSER